MRKKVSVLFIAVSLTISLSVWADTVNFCSAQAGLITFINTDTTWTKANSPYTLNGPIVINTGITLTINPGVAVNLNGYYLYINGTLRVIGTLSENIHIFGGNINFGDNDQVGANSAFENAVLNSTISTIKPLSVKNNTILGSVTAGAASNVTENIISGDVNVGDSSIISKNSINGSITAGDTCMISHNTIFGDTEAGNNASVYYNTMTASRLATNPSTALSAAAYSEITNNTITGGVSATSSTISHNIISGGFPFTDWSMVRVTDSTSAVEVYGNSSVISNVISSTQGYGILVRTGYTYVSGNIVSRGIRVAGDALIENNLINNSGTGIRVGEIYVSAFNSIDYGNGNSVIQNNVITGNNVGVGSTQAGGTATVENNLIYNNTNGIDINSQVSILNNTIFNNTIAINLHISAITITYNNIIGSSQNSVVLSYVSEPVNATYNWWGTTDAQTINLTIHDFKYDLSLGTVNFIPFLTAQNPQAPSTSYTIPPPTVVPEYSSWTIFPLFSFLLLAVFVFSRKLREN